MTKEEIDTDLRYLSDGEESTVSAEVNRLGIYIDCSFALLKKIHDMIDQDKPPTRARLKDLRLEIEKVITLE
jgi:hypothetical protein